MARAERHPQCPENELPRLISYHAGCTNTSQLTNANTRGAAPANAHRNVIDRRPSRHPRQRTLGNPEYGCELQPIDFAAVAHPCGVAGFTVDDPQECGRVIETALGTPGPALVEAVVDPFEPPMPPKVTAEQARKFAESLMKGQPNRRDIALTVLANRVRELV